MSPQSDPPQRRGAPVANAWPALEADWPEIARRLMCAVRSRWLEGVSNHLSLLTLVGLLFEYHPSLAQQLPLL